MTVKRIREEIDALREALIARVAIQQISALADIETRLDRLAARQREAVEQATAADMAGLAAWLNQRFGVELPR